jgi:UDP-N-acetylglucosamine--dolichyl-phosphate N-acetylglucosaminephosphotransferase
MSGKSYLTFLATSNAQVNPYTFFNSRLNKKTGLIEYSRFSLIGVKFPGKIMVLFLEYVLMAKIGRDEEGRLIDCNNLTLLNLILVYFGPLKEGTLALMVMGIQTFGSLLAFVIRYGLVHFIYY